MQFENRPSIYVNQLEYLVDNRIYVESIMIKNAIEIDLSLKYYFGAKRTVRPSVTGILKCIKDIRLSSKCVFLSNSK